MRTITTVLVHPSRLFSEGLKRILDGTPFKPAWLTSGLEDLPLKLFNSGRPLLFIIGSKSTTEMRRVVGSILQRRETARVVVIGDCAEAHSIVAALHAGACGYLQDGMSCEALIKALDLVMQGETVIPAHVVKGLPSEIDTAVLALPSTARSAAARDDSTPAPVPEKPAKMVLPASRPARGDPPPAPVKGSIQVGEKGKLLSSREAEILQCLVRGASNKDIARNLDMAEATVKVHLKAILRKIHVKNRTQAAIWAIGHLANGNGSIDEGLSGFSGPR